MNMHTLKTRALALVPTLRAAHLGALATLTLAAVAGYGVGRSWAYEDWIAISLNSTDATLDRLERLSAAHAERLERLLEKAGTVTHDVAQLQERLAQAEAARELGSIASEPGDPVDD